MNKSEALTILGVVNLSKLEEVLEKGKKANIGEVREWNGEKFQKQSDGKWKMVSEKKEKVEEVEFKRGDEVAYTDKKGVNRMGKITSFHPGGFASLSNNETVKIDSFRKPTRNDVLLASDARVEEKDFSKYESYLKTISDEKLEDSFLKVGNSLKDENGKLKKLSEIEDENELDLRKKLSLMSKELSKRGIY